MSVVTLNANTATSTGTALTAPGGANTKSAWTQLTASSSAACQTISFSMFGGGASSDCLIDIGTGGSGSESVLVSNIPVHIDNTALNFGQHIWLPVAIAASTRIVARYQATSASCSVLPVFYLMDNASSIVLASTTSTTYGANTTDSGGTGVDPGTTANTKGSYAELSASTSDDIDWAMVVVGVRNANSGSSQWLIDIATGASSSESVVLSNLFANKHSAANEIYQQSLGPFPVSIASGTRLSARAQSSVTGSERLIDVTVIGFNGSAAAGGGGAHFSASFM